MELKKGARVLTSDGASVGILDRIITDPETHAVTHLVIACGRWNRRKKLVPAYWLGEKIDHHVRLSVRSCLFACLREFRPGR